MSLAALTLAAAVMATTAEQPPTCENGTCQKAQESKTQAPSVGFPRRILRKEARSTDSKPATISGTTNSRKASRRERRATRRARRGQAPRRVQRRFRSEPNATDQQQAQAEADHMAANAIRGHVGSTIGHFEGVGWSTHDPQPATCTPNRAMRLTADAVSHGPTGYYRVRAWR